MWQHVAAGALLTVGVIVRLVVLDTPPAKTGASFAFYLIGIAFEEEVVYRGFI